MFGNLAGETGLEGDGVGLHTEVGLDERDCGVLDAGISAFGQWVVNTLAERLERYRAFNPKPLLWEMTRTYLECAGGMEGLELQTTSNRAHSVSGMLYGSGVRGRVGR